MSRRPNLIPSTTLNVAVPSDLYARLSAALYSEIEGRVPHGAYSRFIAELLRERFDEKTLDISPFMSLPEKTFHVTGGAESLLALKYHLMESKP
jgi:hypothetical protein